jgi:4-oxalocrotonate tautomerase family enzyme
VPLIEVKLYDWRVTEESVPGIIEKLTDALVESSGVAREHVWVLVDGVSPKNWGVGGKPSG